MQHLMMPVTFCDGGDDDDDDDDYDDDDDNDNQDSKDDDDCGPRISQVMMRDT